MHKPSLFIFMKSACAETHIDTQNTNLPLHIYVTVSLYSW